MPTDDINNATDTPSTWPPPIYAEAHGEPENTSGTNTTVPPEIGRLRWNWGAFLLPIFWAYAHERKFYSYAIVGIWAIVAFSSFAGLDVFDAMTKVGVLIDLIIRIVLAARGPALALRSRRFNDGLPQYFTVQQKWAFWGLGLNLALPLAGLLAFGIMSLEVFK